jgi:hypothetical protein
LGSRRTAQACSTAIVKRIVIPLAARLLSTRPLEDLSAQVKSRMSTEDRIRWRVDHLQMCALAVLGDDSSADISSNSEGKEDFEFR